MSKQLSPESFHLRLIEKADEPQVAELIRKVMPEFGACGDGFAINDAEVDTMWDTYNLKGFIYFVIEMEGRVLGGGGVAPLVGGAADTCELRKMYFLEELRGLGFGKILLARCEAEAKKMGYRKIYLETLKQMHQAKKLYEEFNFKLLSAPMGQTGHHGCDNWYLKEL